MKLLVAFITLFWLSVIAAWWRTAPKRDKPVWDEEPDGVQPFDPRTTGLAFQWVYTTAPVNSPEYYAHWQREYARHQAAIR